MFYNIINNPKRFENILINWFIKNKRDFPWREDKNPYKVLISEFMLQQTNTSTVIPYFEKFIKYWPDIESLSKNNTIKPILIIWQGLGYYKRVYSLLESSKIIINKWNGIIPNKIELLMSLPGIGQYTASAIGAISFNLPVIPVDTNITRIFSRYSSLELSIKKVKNYLNKAFLGPLPLVETGIICQALMDIGSTICKSRKPDCFICPLKDDCLSFKLNVVDKFPIRETNKKEMKNKYGFAFLIKNQINNSILMREHSSNEKGFFSEFMEVPMTPLSLDPLDFDNILLFNSLLLRYFPSMKERIKFIKKIGVIYHRIGNFRLNIMTYQVILSFKENDIEDLSYHWISDTSRFAISTLSKKIVNIKD